LSSDPCDQGDELRRLVGNAVPPFLPPLPQSLGVVEDARQSKVQAQPSALAAQLQRQQSRKIVRQSSARFGAMLGSR